MTVRVELPTQSYGPADFIKHFDGAQEVGTSFRVVRFSCMWVLLSSSWPLQSHSGSVASGSCFFVPMIALVRQYPQYLNVLATDKSREIMNSHSDELSSGASGRNSVTADFFASPAMPGQPEKPCHEWRPQSLSREEGFLLLSAVPIAHHNRDKSVHDECSRNPVSSELF